MNFLQLCRSINQFAAIIQLCFLPQFHQLGRLMQMQLILDGVLNILTIRLCYVLRSASLTSKYVSVRYILGTARHSDHVGLK